MEQKIQEFFLKEFGFSDGLRIYGMVWNNIKCDFLKTVDNSLVGTIVQEEYRFDDRKDSISLRGRKSADGIGHITQIEIHGNLLNLA